MVWDVHIMTCVPRSRFGAGVSIFLGIMDCSPPSWDHWLGLW